MGIGLRTKEILFREKHKIEKELLATQRHPIPMTPDMAQEHHKRLTPFLDSLKQHAPEIDTKQWEFLQHPLIPLAEFEKYMWSEGEIFRATIKIANIGPADAKATVFISFNGGGYFDDQMEKDVLLPSGKIIELQPFVSPADDGVLSALENKPSQRRFAIRLYDEKNREITRNEWPIWIYPNHTDDELATALQGIHITSKIDATANAALDAGQSVLCLSHRITSKRRFELPDHPLFQEFPTDDLALWGKQLFKTPNTRVPPMSETRKGKDNRGKLFVCQMDEPTLRTRPEGRHFLVTLARYMKSPAFLPATPPPENATKAQK
jgi:hypothetical protein